MAMLNDLAAAAATVLAETEDPGADQVRIELTEDTNAVPSIKITIFGAGTPLKVLEPPAGTTDLDGWIDGVIDGLTA